MDRRKSNNSSVSIPSSISEENQKSCLNFLLRNTAGQLPNLLSFKSRGEAVTLLSCLVCDCDKVSIYANEKGEREMNYILIWGEHSGYIYLISQNCFVKQTSQRRNRHTNILDSFPKIMNCTLACLYQKYLLFPLFAIFEFNSLLVHLV